MQLKDTNERNKDNVMKADCMLIFAINPICERSTETNRQHEKVTESGGGCYPARENIESISPNSLIQLYEDECLVI